MSQRSAFSCPMSVFYVQADIYIFYFVAVISCCAADSGKLETIRNAVETVEYAD
jgi:hypothetical protein